MVTACGGHSKSANKGDRASGVSSVGDQVKNDAGVAIEELDSVLHGENRPMEWGCPANERKMALTLSRTRACPSPRPDIKLKAP